MDFTFKLICILISSSLLFSCSSRQHGDYPIQPVPFTQVHINDQFWKPRMETNRTVTIPHAFGKCGETGRFDNFAIAGGLKQGTHRGDFPFDDTDVYKTLEGASYALMLHPDPALDNFLDSLIALIATAQEDDGYLYTARTNNAEQLKNWIGSDRWVNIRRSHELYNMGHLYEAAAAHFQSTGKRNLLDIALKNADLIDATFGQGKRQSPPGHQVIEMGLVKLYRVTGEMKYLKLARFFLDVRGKSLDGRSLDGEYSQDHKPVIEQDEAVGHAVRAAYMYAGMADVAALTGDASYSRAIDRIWENVVGKKLYLTGGIGATGANEGFSQNYELPNMSAYNETCASIGNVYWNHRLFLLHGQAKYIDVLERTLYNALLSGVSLDGKLFFYPNALESVGQHERSPWFGCACCPGNVTRFIASVPGYVYAKKGSDIFVNLFVSSEAEIDLNGRTVKVRQHTDYPWRGDVKINVTPPKEGDQFSLFLRVPGWAQNQVVPSDLYRFMGNSSESFELKINGRPYPTKMKHGYAVVNRAWSSNDVVELIVPMPVLRIIAHDSVAADMGKVALQRGPLVFCAEWPDNENGQVRNLLLPDDALLNTEFAPDVLHGVMVVKGKAIGYAQSDAEGQLEKREQEFTAIPYYAWAHRGPGEMTVWLAREESAVTPVGKPTLASTSAVHASSGTDVQSVHDLLEPKSSIDHDVPFFHWWPNKGTTEWAQYDFARPEDVSQVEVYWFDDTGRGECRTPQSWRILYRSGNEWKPVYSTDAYSVDKDRFNKVIFETVKTKSLRLEIQSQSGFAGGIHEWKVR